MLNSGCILDGKYEVIKVLGKGGMGTVYLCKNIRLQNLWAIKEVKKDFKKNIEILSEPNILRKLRHANIPRIVDIFYENNSLYMVQDYIEGQTLKKYVKEKGFIKTGNICNIILEICNIISYLHSLNPPIIYRDLKPSNIMITPKEEVFLIDFGISKIYKDYDTNEDRYMGTSGFAAPEQYSLGQSCRQTDIYGIGMVMYFMATGKVSYTGLEPLMDDNYDNNVDGNLKKIIQKCVQIDIENRYVSVEELNKEIIIKMLKVNMELQKLNKFKFRKTIIMMVLFIAIFLISIYGLDRNQIISLLF
ncbi:serine/threonine-protein kinase [Clostridium ganghwense]|uniref:non-specific serine/threonine protein kinase n=1 Tax=Clostridium ganghwense TaxID=312089 RepID=A0ABT4CSL2_9CLOT|nr:serine/threonine-protein kinase [Clostridium ganghwense]MCY6371186.1 serine/threonine-protein kinase [Clostridium ganghwense]